MRVTKTKIQPEIIEEITGLVDESVVVEDFTLSVDFATDLYALFAEEMSKRRIIKGYWELFKDVRGLFVKFRIGKLMINVEFYSRARTFFRYLITSKLFYELDKLDPMEALIAFLKMFQPPPPPQPQLQGGTGQDSDSDAQDDQKKQSDDDKQKDEGKGDGQEKKDDDSSGGMGSNKSSKPQPQPQSGKSDGGQDEGSGPGQPQQQPGTGRQSRQQPRRNTKDKKGLSADEDSLPIDMAKFRNSLPKIEKAISIGIFEKDDVKKYLGKNAGIAENELKIHNIMDIIDKIANKVRDREMDILYIARLKEITEHYRRDEVLSSVPYPDNEMTIKNIEESNEILRVLPTEFIHDDDVFMQKFVKKELQVKDYQSRRLKKQALYLLIDVSGSMDGVRNVYASGVALALVRQALTEGSVYFLRFFDHIVKKLYRVTTDKEAEKIMDQLVRRPYSGGGTDIERAIKTAVEDISNDPEKFEKAEIMLITDGDDSVYMDKGELKGIKLHSTVIEGRNGGLEALSNTYTELKEKDFKN